MTLPADFMVPPSLADDFEGIANLIRQAATPAPAPTCQCSKFNPDAYETATLALIRKKESGGTYNILCGGGHFQDYSAFPAWKGFKGSHAAGAYQFEPATWAGVTKETGVPDFGPLSQDINALWLLRKYGPNASQSWQASGPYPERT